MSTRIELPEWINRSTVENAYRLCRIAQATRQQRFADAGMRAARVRDPRLLKALEGGAEILRRMSEEQMGVHGLDVGGIRVQATEYQMWLNAYRMVDEGNMAGAAPYEWWIGAAAFLAGHVS